MTRTQKYEELHEKETINAFFSVPDRNDKNFMKIKFFNLIENLKKNRRFNVVTGNYDYLCNNYDNVDLFFPYMPYKWCVFSQNDIINKKLIEDKKICIIPYMFQMNHYFSNYKDLVNTIPNSLFTLNDDIEEANSQEYYLYCQNPQIEDYDENSKGIWKTNKKHILLAFHWTICNSSFYSDKAQFYNYINEFKQISKKYNDKCEFIARLHPNLYSFFKTGKIKNNIFQVFSNEDGEKCKSIRRQLIELNQYIKFDSLANNEFYSFSGSDCLIHDCGSFKAEYLFCNKPVCFMCNKENTSNNQFNDRELKCHVKAWNWDDIQKFIDDAIDGVDNLKKERLNYLNAINFQKTPSQTIIENIIDNKSIKI